MRGYTIVSAESAEAATTLVQSGYYDEIFGEDRRGGIEILYAERVDPPTPLETTE